MTFRSQLFAVLVASVTSLLCGCSADAGKPTTGPGSGTGTGTGGGNGTGGGTAADAGGNAVEKQPNGAAVPAVIKPDAGAKAEATQLCTKNEDCASGACFAGDQGSYCSVQCTAETAAAVCVSPFVGSCNKKGFCKKG